MALWKTKEFCLRNELMTQSTLDNSPKPELTESSSRRLCQDTRRKKAKKSPERNDVLISAVISPYLLTHLHHVLQRAEYGAAKAGKDYQAANFAQLRKLLCMDARSMKDASAKGIREQDLDQFPQPKTRRKAA